MKRRIAFTCGILLLSACKSSDGIPADAYQHWTDQMIVGLGLPIVGILPCDKQPLPPEQCFKMGPERHWQGVWVTEFEGERFCPRATRSCAYESKPRVGLAFNRVTFPGRPQIRADMNRSYNIDFTGRQAALEGGQYGMRDQLIVVDRLISVTDQGPLQKE